jgi:hypothetical protein
VLQRNVSDYALLVRVDPPVLVEPGEVIDHEHPITGFAPVPPPAPVAGETASAAVAATEETP